MLIREASQLLAAFLIQPLFPPFYIKGKAGGASRDARVGPQPNENYRGRVQRVKANMSADPSRSFPYPSYTRLFSRVYFFSPCAFTMPQVETVTHFKNYRD